ncbi:MAG: nucleotidyltransferase domain-containing protein [Candidatus Hodarchaeales archaeon]|jgi:predicted nucleotidyltransferase
MEQKISKPSKTSKPKISFEIISQLLHKENHARAIAKKLRTNHMTVIRKLKELTDTNVVDSRTEGRNKIYYLKKTLEARGQIIMAELYRLEKTLEKYPELRKIADTIQKDAKIQLAIIFGSHAKGTAKKGSDIDLYIETKNRKIKKELEHLSTRLAVKIGDYDPDSPLIKEIEKNHVIIKGAEKFYEKKKPI